MGMKKLLVTGASGFLGWNICRALQNEWEVYGVVFSHPIQIPGATTVRADLIEFSEVKKLFKALQPDAVIHAAALAQPNACQADPAASKKINVDASLHMAGLCADDQIPCAFTSTDLVFNGLNPPYTEESPPCPVSVYGEHKVLAEEAMFKQYPRVALCRLPLMFGFGGPVAASFMQGWAHAMREGRELKLFVDEYRTPVSAQTAARGLSLALGNVQGLLHLGGRERVSRYEFGLRLRDALDLPHATITACYQKDVPMAAPRPVDVSLDSSKAYALGFRPPYLMEELTSTWGNTSGE
jgi:dTDP-4-dehydrorhamnose reductase